ncbi:MarR family winged helix-turn-helix transcriptional regulator [Protaetiibacter intestinalis]|uniref:MarR family transcriptional regulator n=1 Tax=Protaetiibacter intestinalis TaxID=2419774 RepID=A0A387B7Y8_9MICO|nr:MarR family transcriptional regulator [Protaetiibacter intestinalis]AYF97921.1 MarR family transcriptional regulator [Protaetiibacter intestinalis]
MSTRTLAYWLALVDRLVERGFTGALDEHGVTRMQWRILTALGDGPASAEQLDASLADLPAYDDDATTAEQLSELVESGWVSADGAYRLTERGETARSHIVEAVATLRATLLTGITEDEEAATIALLERMARNLGWDA